MVAQTGNLITDNSPDNTVKCPRRPKRTLWVQLIQILAEALELRLPWSVFTCDPHNGESELFPQALCHGQRIASSYQGISGVECGGHEGLFFHIAENR